MLSRVSRGERPDEKGIDMAYEVPSPRTCGRRGPEIRRRGIVGGCRSRLGNLGRAGHTLAELIVVTMVLGIILSMVITPTGKAIRHARVNRAARVVTMDLKMAFSLAARQHRPVRVTYRPDLRAYTFIDARRGTILHRRELGAGTDFKITGMTVSASTFDIAPTGFASMAVTVVVEGGDFSRTITMMRGGMVRIIPL